MAKTLSWRFAATIVTCSVALLITGKVEFALTIGLLDTGVKLGVYYAHERLWNRVSFGRERPPEYDI